MVCFSVYPFHVFTRIYKSYEGRYCNTAVMRGSSSRLPFHILTLLLYDDESILLANRVHVCIGANGP